MTDPTQTIETVIAVRDAMLGRHEQERLALLVREYGVERVRRDHLGMRMVNPHRDAHDTRARAARSRAEAKDLRGLPAADAARSIEAKRAE